MLYREVPRVAFEAERQRELLLVDRGNQFKRAIQVFVTDKNNNPTRRYPASLDELESFNNHRYLRRRYKDPMTGKDEWRLVHINGGVLTDSVTTQQPNSTSANGAQSGSSTPSPAAYITAQSYVDTGNPNGASMGGAARAMNRRPSDSAQPGAPGAPGSDPSQQAPGSMPSTSGFPAGGIPGQPASGIPGMPNPTGVPGVAGIPGLPGMPGAPGAPTGGQAAQPCTVYIGSCPPTTTTGGQNGQSGLPPQPGNPVNSQMGGVSPAYPTTPGSNANIPGVGQAGLQMNPQAQGAAASLINGILTTPRPGGMPTTMPGASLGGGIAGVASKYEAEGIMVINNRTAINEWEYIFDATKYRVPPNPVSGTVGTPQAPMNPSGAPPGTPIGTPIGPNTNSSTGTGSTGH